jgi:DNA end-binding protein Ku
VVAVSFQSQRVYPMVKKHRVYWKGYLRLSLVTIGVEVYNAVETKSEKSFRQIHKPSGKRINYEKVVAGIGRVDSGDIAKGYEVDTDTFVVLEPAELDALKLESKRTIDLVQFVDATDLHYRYFERPYFVAPSDALAGEGFVVIREALAMTGKVGLAQVTIGGREWLVAIAPMDTGLMMELLRYSDELRDPAEFFGDVPSSPPPKELVDLAVQLIGQKSGAFKPEGFRDRYQDALKALIQDKMRGRTIVAPDDAPRPSGSNVIDLMEALKRSLGDSQKSRQRTSDKTSRRKRAGGATSSPSRKQKRG